MTDDQPEVLVFDTGPLMHFARNSWLGVLKAVVADRVALVPDAVVDELKQGAATDSQVRAVLDATWIERRPIDADALPVLAKYASRLVVGTRNLGEAAVLTLAETVPGVAVVDDGAGRTVGRANGVEVKPTLALLCDAIRSGLLTARLVAELTDDLIVDQYRLPFKRGEFIPWAIGEGLIPETE